MNLKFKNFNKFAILESCMLKLCASGPLVRALHSTRLCARVYNFSGDQLWWSIRKPGLDTTKQSGGRRTILVPRIDFWEQTKYGHGGAAKLWAGLKDNHDEFKKGRADETAPSDRTYAVDAFDSLVRISKLNFLKIIYANIYREKRTAIKS